MPRISEFWKHFTKLSSSAAKCNHCGNVLKTSGNTSNLKCHMQSVHGELLTASSSAKSVSNVNSVASKNYKQTTLVEDDEDEALLSSLLPSTSRSSSCSNLSSVPSQQSIVSAFQHVKDYKSGGKKNEKVSQAIVFMICRDMQPIRTVERQGFLKLMKVCSPLYVVPSRFTIKRMINDKFVALQHVLKEKLREKYVTITTDAWTDIQMRSYLSATARFIDKGDKLYNGNLGLIPLDESHTAEYLASKLKDLFSDWGLTEEFIVAIVTDGAPNIVKAAHLAVDPKKHIHCFAHNLNLVGQRAIERSGDVQELVDHIKRIVKWFKHSVVASDQLRKLNDKKLIQSVPTRWNSTPRK
ncbi:PREDICTED: zinc finger BED domain-containing protein 4-like, partial [Rhagoletis zephyria]|uniref:zinc finger BED domain-containing protein 4-like n=1 Tax=Rhagoletis zephyria TaxID=28612 RepID=UPI00081136B3